MKLVVNLSSALILLILASIVAAAGLVVVVGVAYGMLYGGVYILKKLAAH